MKKIVSILTFVLSALLFTSCASSQSSALGYREIDMSEAVKIMKSESDYIILDVRTAEEFRERHIPGAINVANEDIGDAPIPALPDKDRLILVYCRSGRRSKEAAKKLASLGYTNIVEFGGINDWQGETVSGS